MRLCLSHLFMFPRLFSRLIRYLPRAARWSSMIDISLHVPHQAWSIQRFWYAPCREVLCDC